MWKGVSLFALIFLTCELENGAAELKATWLPVSYNTSTAENVDEMIASLSAHGVQRVYVDVWNQGTVYFQSPTMQSYTPNGQGRDILSWAVRSGDRYGIEIVAWFEYGLMTSYGSLNNAFATKASSDGWVLGQANHFFWLDPSNAKVQQFVAGIIVDAIKAFPSGGLLGVQLDDHFGMPVSLGGTTAATQAMANYVYKAVKAASSQTLFSLAPAPHSQALSEFAVDWNRWGELGLFDEVVPQLYRADFKSFATLFDQTLAGMTSSTAKLCRAVGLRVDGSGTATPWSEVVKMAQHSSSKGIGSSYWYARGYLAGISSELMASSRPIFPARQVTVV